MDPNRFDVLTSRLVAAPSRRRALRLIGGLGFAGLLGQSNAAAKKKKKACPPCPAPSSSPPPPQVPKPFCAGRNQCVTPTACQASGSQCYCWLRADVGHIGEPFCGKIDVPLVGFNCNDCPAGTVCIVRGGICDGGLACVEPCANPLP